jgi:Ca-activated chloride channel family protein
MIRFANPYFLLLCLPLAISIWISYKKKQEPFVYFPFLSFLQSFHHHGFEKLLRLCFWLRFIALFLLIMALARPQTLFFQREINTEGIDLLLAIDVSGSMAAEDFKPSRLEVAKKTLKEFVQQRESDRIGLIIFGGEAFTQSPLTLDYTVVLSAIDQIKLNMAGDGTAIGMAIATALNRFKYSKTNSKVIVLATDGENNRGEIDPRTGTQLAKEMGVKIYTIGIGKEGGAPIPVIDPERGKFYPRNPDGSYILTKLDETLLKEIAESTQGKYFRATDNRALKNIFDQINRLEKTTIKTYQYDQYVEHFMWLLGLALSLLTLEWVLRFVVVRANT